MSVKEYVTGLEMNAMIRSFAMSAMADFSMMQGSLH
jgi:hypothetical protein